MRVAIETRAKLHIQKRILSGELALSTSFMNVSENNDNPLEDRRIPIGEFLRNGETHIVFSDDIVNDTERFIASIIEEPFDYTEWQQGMYADMSVRDLAEYAKMNATRGGA